MLRGGAEVAAEAGCFVAGGHTIDDPVPKYGLAVTGLADPARLMTIDRATPGDQLILTKAIGTGLGLTIAKRNVELNGGAIDVRSERGAGTAVTISVPAT